MSYDLAIWKASRALTDQEARAIYADLETSKALEASPAIARFYRALIDLHPELDVDDDPDACPWSATLDHTKRYVIAPMVFSQAPDVSLEILALAGRHELDVFDPQTGKLVAAGVSRKSRKTPKQPAPIHAAAELAAKLAAPFARHGFASIESPDGSPGVGMPTFIRTDGIATQEFTFRRMAQRHTTAWLRIHLAPVSTILDPFTVGWKRGLFGGWQDGVISHDLYGLSHEVFDRKQLIGDHALGPAEIAKTVRAVARELSKYALPLFDRLHTVKQVDAFLHGTPGTLQASAHVMPFELAFSGTIIAKLASRRDFATWVAAYKARIKRPDALKPPHRRAALAAYPKLVAQLSKR